MQFSFVNIGFSSASSSPFRVYLISLKWNSSPPSPPLVLLYPLSVAIPADSYIAELYTHHPDTVTGPHVCTGETFLHTAFSQRRLYLTCIQYYKLKHRPLWVATGQKVRFPLWLRKQYAHRTFTECSRYVHIHSKRSLLCLNATVRDSTIIWPLLKQLQRKQSFFRT